MKLILLLLSFCVSLTACAQNQKTKLTAKVPATTIRLTNYPTVEEKVTKSEAEWKKELSPEAYYVLREKGTERAFTGKYNNSHERGLYSCAGCGNPLFDSATKFDSGTGWPSFYAPIEKKRVQEVLDKAHGMLRREVVCARCGGHLGHVFDDGPKPTGERYCMNSVSLEFEKK
jgi:peptide-methionine (R)-S-oxide reductase